MSAARPLAGLRVVVTRAENQAAELLKAYRRVGASVVTLPLIEVVPPADVDNLERAAQRTGEVQWVVFTSANAVEAFVPRVQPWPRRLRVAAVGAATARALASLGRGTDLMPEYADAKTLAAALAAHLPAGTEALLPQADDAGLDLAAALADAGIRPRAVTAYAKRLPAAAAARASEIFEHHPLGWVTFTSPRIARAFIEVLGETWPQRRDELRAVSIGPVTSAALRGLGVEPAAEARYPGAEELVTATIDALSRGAQRR